MIGMSLSDGASAVAGDAAASVGRFDGAVFDSAKLGREGLRRLGAATVLDVSVAGVRVTNSWAARHSLRARYTGHSKVAPTLFG